MKQAMSCSALVYKNALFYVYELQCRAEHVKIVSITL